MFFNRRDKIITGGAVLESSLWVLQLLGHLTPYSNTATKSVENANSNSAALVITVGGKTGGSQSDNCPGS